MSCRRPKRRKRSDDSWQLGLTTKLPWKIFGNSHENVSQICPKSQINANDINRSEIFRNLSYLSNWSVHKLHCITRSWSFENKLIEFHLSENQDRVLWLWIFENHSETIYHLSHIPIKIFHMVIPSVTSTESDQ